MGKQDVEIMFQDLNRLEHQRENLSGQKLFACQLFKDAYKKKRLSSTRT